MMKTAKNRIMVGMVAFLLAFALIGFANAAYPDMVVVYDSEEWSLIAFGEGTAIFPDSEEWETVVGNTVVPTFPNARNTVECSGGILYTTFARADTNTIDVIVALSSDRGDTWVETVVAEGTETLYHGMPTLDIDGADHIHLAWVSYNLTDDVSHIQYNNNTALGEWGTAIAIVDDAYNQTHPAIAVSGTAYIVWQGIHRDTNVSTIFGWNSSELGTDISTIKGVDVEQDPLTHPSYRYPGIVIRDTEEMVISYFIAKTDGTTDIGVIEAVSDWTMGAYNSSIGEYVDDGIQGRNPSIALNSTGHIMLAWKGYDPDPVPDGAYTSYVMVSRQTDTDNLVSWEHQGLEVFDSPCVWIYPSIASSSIDDIIVTAMLIDNTYGVSEGFFYGNITADFSLMQSWITVAPENVVYGFANMAYSSRSNNGQDNAYNTLWILETGTEANGDYLSTSIVLMGDSVVGSYTHPTVTPPVAPPATRVWGDTVTLFSGLIPVIVIIGVLLLLIGGFLGDGIKRGG